MGTKKNSQSAWTWRAAGEMASRQQGLVTRGQLRSLELSDEAISKAVSRGWLRPVFHAVFAVGHDHLTPHARLLAATLACGPGTVVSHGTAAWLLGLREWEPREVDVIAPVEAGRKIAGVKRRFVPVPRGEEVWVRDGVPVTSAGRTVVDCAGILNRRGVTDLLQEAAVRGLLDVRAIDRVLDGPRRRGAKFLRVAIAPWRRYQPGIKLRSRMEAKLLPLLSEASLSIPETNAKVRVGGRTYEVDFLWRREKLVVETDGGRFHDNPAAGARDSERSRNLIAAGYEVPRLGWEDLRDRPRPTVEEIGRLLRTRADVTTPRSVQIGSSPSARQTRTDAPSKIRATTR